MLIDGPSLVYRGYFALPPLTMSDGTLVNAVFGFLQIVLRGMQDVKPDFAIVSFDVGKPQFRFDAFPDYKKGRPSMPDDLRAQFPIVREITAMMGMPVRELEGYEADDVIGTLTKKATAQGVDTMIVSGDLDGLQLVDDNVRLLTTRMGVAATVIYDEARVMERYGLRPDQMLDYKALKGDTSDNIPGVPGVGEKTAISLLQQFGTLDGIYERLDEVKGKLRDRLAEHRESAFMSREIGRIITDLPGRARTGRGTHGPIRPPRRGAALPRARVPVAHRPAAGVEHRADRVRQPGDRDQGRAAAQPRPARRPAGADAAAAADGDAAERDPTRSRIRAGPIEHVDPRIARTAADFDELGGVATRPTATRSASAGRSARDGRRSGTCSGSPSPPATGARGTSAATRRATRCSGCRPSSCSRAACASVTTSSSWSRRCGPTATSSWAARSSTRSWPATW